MISAGKRWRLYRADASSVMPIDYCLDPHQPVKATPPVVKTTVLVTDLGEFAAINDVYARYFAEPFPARACYQVAALPRGAMVEVEAVIALD
ncbi:hypothetical protein B5M41_016630 [Shinella sumterensis]|nr:hypothetical protein [Shinella sumterensis]